MKAGKVVTIGAILICTIFVTGGLAHRYLRPETVDVITFQKNGLDGFMALFSPQAWRSLTGQEFPNDIPLVDRAEERVRAAIDKGMQGNREGCPDRWLVSTITRDEAGSVKIVGVCQTSL